ncbi:MAG: glycosyltransferase [Pseudomonadota bacterium]|nr:glycosyltransferase [Pseudomonadota bacterium]
METILMAAPLGEVLRARGFVNETQLQHALSLQRQNGGRLGDILVGMGAIGYLSLYQAVAEHYGLAFADLLREPPDGNLLAESDLGLYLQLRALPWRRSSDGAVLVACCDPFSEDIRDWSQWRFGPNVRPVITSPFDIRRAAEHRFAAAIENGSRLSLWRADPRLSARTALPLEKKLIAFVLVAAVLSATVIAPLQTALAFIVLCHAVFTARMLFKCIVFDCGVRASHSRNWEHLLAALDERELPVYTVLVPMYREAAVLPRLLAEIAQLDYPAARLDIKLVMEEDDRETFDAATALKPHYQFDIIRVPASRLRTKPKACNYALRFARGEFVTIFDADDRPEPLQLKKAVWAFRHLPPDIVCLQARLNYYNAGDNWLTCFFSLEYTILFQFMLYGLERLGIPIPLGGTSNHIAIGRLRSLGEWDPYNVTEDADLGARLAARGLRTAMLDSCTMEEAPNAVGPWIRQRSRWIKGYLQTWLVHMRHPAGLWRTLGWKGFIGFQFFVGLSGFIFLIAPILWMLSLLWIGQLLKLHTAAFPAWLGWLTLFNLILNLASHWYLALHSALHYRKLALPIAIAAVFYPFYFLLHSVASYKALWQLLFRPHFWEKTTHGLARQADIAAEGELLRAEGKTAAFQAA